MRGLLDWKAPIWAQLLVSAASLTVAVMRVQGSFRRRAWFDAALMLGCGFMLVLVAYAGLRANREGRQDWGWGAVLGYGAFGAVLIGIGLRLGWR